MSSDRKTTHSAGLKSDGWTELHFKSYYGDLEAAKKYILDSPIDICLIDKVHLSEVFA